MDPANLTASDLAGEYRRRSVTPVDVIEECMRRIDDSAHLNAYTFLDPSTSRRLAEQSSLRHKSGSPLGLLDGVPFAIKDVLSLEGWPTRRGSLAATAAPADYTSPPVQRLLDYGAIPVGKTATAELGWKAVTDSKLVGITRNPTAPARTTGGSSGGSAAAVAARTVPVALGTDGGGSIRIPASFCGVVGAIRTYGSVPFWPAPPLSTLVRCGPITRSVGDAILVFSALSRRDPRVTDGAASPSLDLLPSSPSPLKIGVCTQIDGLRPTHEVNLSFEFVLESLRNQGHDLVDVADSFGGAGASFEALWSAGHARMVDNQYSPDQVSDVGLMRLAAKGRLQRSTEYLYAESEKLRLAAEVTRVLAPLDLLLTPTVAVEPFDAGVDTPRGWPDPVWWSWASFSYLFNLSGHPALTLPAGRNSSGLPFGIQLVGRRDGERTLFAAALALERILR